MFNDPEYDSYELIWHDPVDPVYVIGAEMCLHDDHYYLAYVVLDENPFTELEEAFFAEGDRLSAAVVLAPDDFGDLDELPLAA